MLRDENVQFSEPQRLSWEEIEGPAREMFNVWVDQPELRWARNAWELLSLVGLTRYSNATELTIVKIRLMALAAFYRDFCHFAWQETNYPLYVAWSQSLSLTHIRIGQLLPQNEEWARLNDDLLLSQGLTHIADRERSSIVSALVQAYGVSSLICALYNSNREPIPAQADKIDETVSYEETPEQILNQSGDTLGPAFEWLDQGGEAVLECGG